MEGVLDYVRQDTVSALELVCSVYDIILRNPLVLTTLKTYMKQTDKNRKSLELFLEL